MAVAVHQPQIFQPQRQQVGARALVQRLDPLHRVRLRKDLGQHRGLVAAAGPDLEHLPGFPSRRTSSIIRATTKGWEMVCEKPIGSAVSS
jgi:hypothetical protein